MDSDSESELMENYPDFAQALQHLLMQQIQEYQEMQSRKPKEPTPVVEKKTTTLRPLSPRECHSLCTSVHQALPREIRDMIYEYTHAQETIYVGPEYFEKTTVPCESDAKAHYWSAQYVGAEMQREIIESWYRTTLFYFYDKRNNNTVIEKFLDTDRWGHNIKPRDLICRARVELSVEERLHNNYKQRPCCYVRDAGEKLTRVFKLFHQLPNHVEFFMRVHTYDAPHTGCMSASELQGAIHALVEELGTLNSMGHRVVLQWPDLNNVELSWKDGAFKASEWTKQLMQAAPMKLSLEDGIPESSAGDVSQTTE
ncbi:hypothetical protein COCCADRAFT_35984 [Bipolaris zeicola 26-R-13]|uniref:Uncharacterized protein n=1 Tax=Cochliobolus carbonum (strain 26-R-13) TaxID=930089 RepID=W6Y8R0_COCC2|nr:uncharacterized protein COCCADRAFT_35984 [Bipolaris zeicola 26-R-13]EUC34318.1 hypothetical protein COCCADRAFT_35984 [Bipolaris zeicola 26-R-13]